MSSLERTVIEVVAVILLICGFTLYERHRGAVACENSDKAAVAQQEAHNAVILATQTQSINQEAIDHAKALAALPDPTPVLSCVRYYTPPVVPKAPAPKPAGHGPTKLPVSDSRGFDPGLKLARIGQAADAQIIELQAFIRDVCLK